MGDGMTRRIGVDGCHSQYSVKDRREPFYGRSPFSAQGGIRYIILLKPIAVGIVIRNVEEHEALMA